MTSSHVPSSRDIQKSAAARAAVAQVQDGMIVGIGTGSTIAFAIAALAERCREGMQITAVATSLKTEASARAAGIRISDFADIATLDLSIDGVDEIDPEFRAIKGAGGALLREKIVATATHRMVAIADSAKLVPWLGQAAVPIEILPFAKSAVLQQVTELGCIAVLRTNRDGSPYRTDQNNLIADCAFGRLPDPEKLSAELSTVPGILGHGLFLTEIDELFVGSADGVEMLSKGVQT